MTVEVMSRELRYNGKPGRSFRRSKEDLALFEDLSTSKDLESALADMETSALADDQFSVGGTEKDVSDSDTEKNDDDWLVPAPEVPPSPQPHESNLIINRNLSAIKTSRPAVMDQPRVSTPKRNPSPKVHTRIHKSPQELKQTNPSKIPRFDGSSSNSNNTNNNSTRKSASSPKPTSIPRASSSPRMSTPSSIPRVFSSPRTSSSGIRPPSPKSKWTTSTKIVSPTPTKTTLTAKGTSPTFRRTSTTSPSASTTSSTTTGRRLSSGCGVTRSSSTASSAASLPSTPRSAGAIPSRGVSPPIAVKASKPAYAYDFLSETPANLRTNPFNARESSGSHGALGRSYDEPSYSRDGPPTSNNFVDHISKTPDRESGDLSRGQDQSEYKFGYKSATGSVGAYKSGPEVLAHKASLIPECGGIGRRTLEENDVLLRNSKQRVTSFQEDAAAANSFMKRPTADASCETGCNVQTKSSVSSSGGFKPFTTNSSIPSLNSHIPSISHRKPHPLESESSKSGNDSVEDPQPLEMKSGIWDEPECSDHSFSELFGPDDEDSRSSGDQKCAVRRTQIGFTLKEGDTRIHTSSSSSPQVDIESICMDSGAELCKGAVISQSNPEATVKIYQGHGDMEDLGDNWCCGMGDQYRSLCKQHDCGIFRNFHNVLVLNSSSDIIKPCPSTSDQKILYGSNMEKKALEPLSFTNDVGWKSSSSGPDGKAPVTESTEVLENVPKKEDQLIGNQIESSSILDDFLEQLGPSDHITNCNNSRSQKVGDVKNVEVSGWEALSSSSSTRSLNRTSDLSPNCGVSAEEERRSSVQETTVWKHTSASSSSDFVSPPVFKSRTEDVRPPASALWDEGKTRRPKVEKNRDLSVKKNGYKWELEILETSRPRQLKPPDFFDVTKRNEDGEIVAAISSVKSLSASECGDDEQRLNGKLVSTAKSAFRSSSMSDGSQISHSGSEAGDFDADQSRTNRAFSPESDAILARSDSDGDTDGGHEIHKTNYMIDGDSDIDTSKSERSCQQTSYLSEARDSLTHSPSDTPGDSPRETSQLSRTSSTKSLQEPLQSVVHRFFSTSATSIDLTRSIDTTCSTQSPYDNSLWEEPTDSCRFGDSLTQKSRLTTPLPAEVGCMKIGEESVLISAREQGANAMDHSDLSQTSMYEYGLEKLAAYMRSASLNARKRRASVTSSETDSKISLSRESSFDYFVDFLEAQTRSDPEARAVTDLLVSAHIEAKRVDFPPGYIYLKRLNSTQSTSSLRSEKSVEIRVVDNEGWESNKTIQTLENKEEGTEQIVENVTPHASLDKHLSSFKFGQKKLMTGEFESITTLEVVPESPVSSPSHSRRRYENFLPSTVVSDPLCQKFLKQIEEQHSVCEGHAHSALKSAQEPIDVKLVEPVEQLKEEELAVPQDRSSAASSFSSHCDSLRLSSGHVDEESRKENSAAAVRTIEPQQEREMEEKKNSNASVKDISDSQPDVEKAMVEQMLPPVPNQMSKDATPKDVSISSPGRESMAITTTTAAIKRVNSNEVGENNDKDAKICGCTIL